MNSIKRYILFLGGAGFLGRNVLAMFPPEYCRVNGLIFIVAGRQGTSNSLPEHEYIQQIALDYTQHDALETVFEQYPVTEVFHFASSSVPANSNNDMTADIQQNLLGTVRLLEMMSKYNIRKITFLSSGGAVYGNAQNRAFQEDDFNNPNNSYGVVKLAIEKYILLFHKLYNIDYLILRVSNPFGPYHTSAKNGIINIAIRNAIRGIPVRVWGDGSNTKDYIYAPDFARIFRQLFEMNISSQILNLGSGNRYSVLDILHAIKKTIPELHWMFEESKSFDTPHVAFKLDALRRILTPESTNFEQAVQETCTWEKEHISVLK